MRDCENCIHRVPRLTEDNGWTAECEVWNCKFEPRKRPAGEWIRSEETTEDLSGSIETYTRSTCSVCNQANGWGEVPYCPWCGARMEKKDEQHGETDQEQTGGNQAAD